MRPNQREGVEWLRKAADSASLEVADDEDSMKDGKHTDFNERNTRRAQFALSIYELGVSHMNGWGIEQDKALALRCFEIAGTWGDGDALAEAGFCYAQGVGCKKDLKKAARFYRMAEAKGMSTIGNSWYGSTTHGGDQAKADLVVGSTSPSTLTIWMSDRPDHPSKTRRKGRHGINLRRGQCLGGRNHLRRNREIHAIILFHLFTI